MYEYPLTELRNYIRIEFQEYSIVVFVKYSIVVLSQWRFTRKRKGWYGLSTHYCHYYANYLFN